VIVPGRLAGTALPALALLGLLTAGSAPAQQPTGSEMSATMQDLAGAMTTLLEASTAPMTEADADTGAALEILREHASMLTQHLDRDDAAFISAALEKQTLILRRNARMGDREAFAAALDRGVGTCVACHLRTSRPAATRFARTLVPPEVEQRLPPRRKARIQMATRRYEEARATLESALAGAGDEDRQMLLHAYLDVLLRGLSSPSRALAFLQSLPEPVGPEVVAWRESLQHWQAREGAEPQLELAWERLDRARGLGGAGRVDAAMAVNVAQRWLETGTGSAEDSALAHLVLGSGEHALWTEAWLPMPELYLEQAILLAPGSDTARVAYRELERALARRFAGEPLPEEVATHLQGLKP
jgi:hypothetical protein